MHIYIIIYMYICLEVHICLCIYVYLYIYVYMCMYMYTCTHKVMYSYIFIYKYTHIYIYIYIYIYEMYINIYIGGTPIVATVTRMSPSARRHSNRRGYEFALTKNLLHTCIRIYLCIHMHTHSRGTRVPAMVTEKKLNNRHIYIYLYIHIFIHLYAYTFRRDTFCCNGHAPVAECAGAF